MLRRAFAGWERTCQVREWRQPALLAKEAAAGAYFRRRLLAAWRGVAEAGRWEGAARAGRVALLPAKKAMAGWRLVCAAAWRRRGRLCKRLFSNLRRRVQERRYGEAHRHNAIALWAWLNKRCALSSSARHLILLSSPSPPLHTHTHLPPPHLPLPSQGPSCVAGWAW